MECLQKAKQLVRKFRGSQGRQRADVYGERRFDIATYRNFVPGRLHVSGGERRPRDPLPTASSFVRLRKAPYLKHPRSGCPSLTSFRSILFTSITALALRRSNISVAWSKLFHLPPRHSAIKIVQTFTVPLQKMWFEN